MNIAERSFQDLYPHKDLPEIKLKYSGRHSPYNGNIKQINGKLFFSLSREWKTIDENIKMGILQYLIQKLYRRRGEMPKTTMYMDLYNNFTKNLHLSIPKTESDPVLEESFHRLNERFSLGLEITNLVWGDYTKRTLGTYNYQTDTIKISSFLRTAPQQLRDYVIYHEMLHKKVKFRHNCLRTHHHNKIFREMERLFADEKLMEKEIGDYLRFKRAPRVSQGVVAGKRLERGSRDLQSLNIDEARRDKEKGNKDSGRDFSLRRWLFG